MKLDHKIGPCPDCVVPPGTRHKSGCDVARCLLNGTQHLQCPADEVYDEETDEWVWDEFPEGQHPTDTWTGLWPGIQQCRDLNWFTEMPGIDGPTEDLNRLNLMGQAVYGWDPVNEKWNIPLDKAEPKV